MFAASVASTSKVWLPLLRLVKFCGLVQAAKAAPSKRHWKLLPAAVDVKLKLALLLLVGFDGFAVIFVSGAVVSASMVKDSVLEVPPPGAGLTTVT